VSGESGGDVCIFCFNYFIRCIHPLGVDFVEDFSTEGKKMAIWWL
jgi:hypothetical protein